MAGRDRDRVVQVFREDRRVCGMSWGPRHRQSLSVAQPRVAALLCAPAWSLHCAGSGHLAQNLPLTAWAQPLGWDPGPPKSKDAGAALGGRWGTPRACTVISTREPGHTGVPEGSCLRTEK